MAQERDEIAHGRKGDAGDARVRRLVPEFVDRQRRWRRAFRQQANAPRIDELPLVVRDFDALVALAPAHHQPRLALVERRGRIGQHDGVGRRDALADLEFLADAADHRLAVLERERKADGHQAVALRQRRIPARPDERQTALEQEAGAGMGARDRIVQLDRVQGIGGHDAVQPADQLVAAVGDLVEHDAAGARRISRAEDLEIDLVVDQAAAHCARPCRDRRCRCFEGCSDRACRGQRPSAVHKNPLCRRSWPSAKDCTLSIRMSITRPL